MRTLTRAHRDLLALLRGETPAADVAETIDWAAVAEIAVEENVGPFLYGILTGPRPNAHRGAPPEVLRRLERDFYFSWTLTTILHDAWLELASAIDARGFKVVALKGLLFSRSLYPSPAERPMVDLDLLVRPGDRSEIESMLAALGYARSGWTVRPATKEAMFERRYTRSAGRFTATVEPHTGLGPFERYRVDYGALWDRLVPPSSYGVGDWPASVLAMTAEDNLLHMCLHEVNHVFDENDLRVALDLHAIIVRWSPDWKVVLERARAWGLLTALHLCLLRVRVLMRTPVPDEILAASRPGLLRRLWLAFWLDLQGLGLYRFDGHPGWVKRVVAGFALMDRTADRFRFARHYAALRWRDLRSGGPIRGGGPPSVPG